MTPAARHTHRPLARLTARCALVAFAAIALFTAGCNDDAEPTATPAAAEPTTAVTAAATPAVAATAMATATPAAGGSELVAVTLMLNWTPNNHHAGIYAASELGWYEEAGLQVDIVEPAASGADAIVGAGQAEFGISIAEAVIPARAAGIPVVSIATILPHNDSSLMALASTGISEPGDLAGKTYGGFGGALERELITTLVECGGGDPATVEFVDVGNVDYISGMEQGRYDFVWVFEGWDALRAREVLGKEINTIRFIDHTDCIPDWYTPLIITNESMIADNPDTVRAFLEATARGYRFAIEDPAGAAAALLAAAPELDAALVNPAADYHAPLFADEGQPWGVQDADVWSRFEQFLRTAGLTDAEVDTTQAFTNDFLPEQGG